MNSEKICENCKWSCYESGFIYCNAQDISIKEEQTDCDGWEEQS